MLRRLIKELGGLSEREFAALGAAIAIKPRSGVDAREDRLQWIARQEEAAVRLARARVEQAYDARRPIDPLTPTIELGEAITLVGLAVRRRFDLMRLEAMQ